MAFGRIQAMRQSQNDSFIVPPLQSGGVMLTYRCDNACQHCLYECSPKHQDPFATEGMIDRIMAALSKERSLDGIHFGGGESSLDFDRLLYAVRGARRHGVHMDYLETNARWCKDEAIASERFQQLRDAGLPGVLISASLFHLEFVPIQKTLNAINAANKVFGGAFVWTSEVLRLMSRLEHDRTYPLKESCRLLGINRENGDLWRLHSYLNPSGRAAKRLSDGLPRYTPEHFANESCGRTLAGTSHFHLDLHGRLFTGHCPGISVATVDDLHPTVTMQTASVFMTLCSGGPFAVWKTYASDWTPDQDGYIGKCHFCLDLRKHLFATQHHPEIETAELYRN